MLRIAVIGGGKHSQENHLPALARFIARFPGEIEPAAFCDLQHGVAEKMAQAYSFSAFYTDVGDMLDGEELDGCIAVTPTPVTAPVARQIMEAGIPLLMEKPPGSTPEEAKELCEYAARTKASVMVSMNRRFDPALQAACTWRSDRPLNYVRASILRHRRTEEVFFKDTAIHAMDTLRWIAGEIADYSVTARRVDGVWWYRVQLEFESGTEGLLEVMPSCGNQAECYEMLGPDYRIRASVGEMDDGLYTAWEEGHRVQHDEPARGMPSFVQNGAYAETVAFLTALREKQPLHPSPKEVWPSVDLCHRIYNDVTQEKE